MIGQRLLKSLFLGVLSLCLFTLTACSSLPVTASSITHLTLWQGVNPPPNRDVLQRLVEQFNQTHPQIQVESLYVGQGDQQMPKILAAIVGNAAPDLLWQAPTITGQLVDLEALYPLETWLDASPLKEQLDPSLLESMQLEGHTWSVPFGTNNVGLFYRPSLFKAAGITTLPKTWADLRQVAKQLTIPAQNQHGMLLPLGKGEWTVFTWLPFMWSGGGELTATGDSSLAGSAVSSSGSGVQIANPGAIAALSFWRDLIADGSVVLSSPERGYELDSFLAGKVAMQLTGPWTLAQLDATKVDYGVIPMPAQVRQATSTGGENLFVLKSTPQRQQAALVFAEYVLSEAFQTEWALGTGYLPVNLRSRRSPAYLQYVAQQPVVSVFLDQAQYGRSRPIFPGYNRISDSLGRAIETVLLGKATPEAALATAQQRLDLILQR
jgi:multiple sugar transport system substrate-binding protein